MKEFIKLGLSENLADKLKEERIVEPTDIQTMAIPQILRGKDLIGQSETGSGKTYAFILPILEMVKENGITQALIITPTRELARQITEETKKLTEDRDLQVLSVYGGQDVASQVSKLDRGAEIVVGTPGRLKDHIGRSTIDLSKVRFLVLDEADEIIKMGFLEDTEAIIKQTPRSRQTLLFSATISKGVGSMGKKFMKSPIKFETRQSFKKLENIEEKLMETTQREKYDDFKAYLAEENPFMAIIFCRSKRRVSELRDKMQIDGYNVDELHGDLSQAKRERALKDFRDLKTQYLVATDIAARGLDIDGVTHVINYDYPENETWYIHRIGRTGRAGEEGVAVTFVTEEDRKRELYKENQAKRDSKKKDDREPKKKYKKVRGSKNKQRYYKDKNKRKSFSKKGKRG